MITSNYRIYGASTDAVPTAATTTPQPGTPSGTQATSTPTSATPAKTTTAASGTVYGKMPYCLERYEKAKKWMKENSARLQELNRKAVASGAASLSTAEKALIYRWEIDRQLTAWMEAAYGPITSRYPKCPPTATSLAKTAGYAAAGVAGVAAVGGLAYWLLK